MVDKAKVKEAIRLLLEGIGEDPEREGLKDTPHRTYVYRNLWRPGRRS